MADSFAGASDKEIVAQLQRGNEQGLAALMARYFDDIAEVAFHYLGNRDVAGDVAQDVFIRLWNRRESLDENKPIIHYLRRASRNRAYDVLDSDSSARRTAGRAFGDYNAAVLHDVNTGPRSVEQDEIDAAVYRAAEALSPRVREVALLYYRGLQPGEIAEMLEVAPRTVYNQLRTALPVLAKALSQPQWT
jgi:RNA polymerase sigma factor (sigma-70 family)